MRIVHISDLHFGTESPDGVAALGRAIRSSGADLVAVSGDLTQVGSREEFHAARRFLDAVEAPLLCVPGNHDQPRFRLWRRFTDPFSRFRRYITAERVPVHRGEGVVVAGINSARPLVPHWNWANGAISRRQLDRLQDVYNASAAPVRVCVLHHPIHRAGDVPVRTRVFGARRARRAMEQMRVDLVLTGHVHTSSLESRGDGHSTAYLSASTALSSRQRGEANGFNLVDVTAERLSVVFYRREEHDFAPAGETVVPLGARAEGVAPVDTTAQDRQAPRCSPGSPG
jgi:3',5'-cyclic AMP phosphodiesterase CpdA